ncbi:MAG: hypothetical protein U1F55_06455 [Chitinivorax sp.]|jgi:hypothetical protein
MKNLLYSMIIGLLVFGLYRLFAGGSSSSDIEQRYREPILAALKEEFAQSSPLCVYEGPFPRTMSRGEVCLQCDKLQRAGLIEKRQEDEENKKFDWALTEAGISAYREDTESGSSRSRPRLCFGDASVGKVIAALPSMKLGDSRYLSFKYQVRVSNPHPWLKSGQVKELGMDPLAASGDVLDKVYTNTALIPPGGHGISFDGSFRYGKWVNEK